MKQKGLSLMLTIAIPVIALVVLFGFVKPAYAAILIVGTDCLTIQGCIDNATGGDTILIPAGSYTESLTLNQPISLTGVNSATTIIQALPGQRVLTVTGASIGSSVVISGLTFTGGDVDTGNLCAPPTVDTNCGGGIFVTDNAQPTIQYVILRENEALRGGGLYAAPGSHLTLRHIDFINNVTTLAGGGLSVNGASLTVIHGLFSGNMSTQNVAGGLHIGTNFSNFQTVLITGSTFIGNAAACLGGHFPSVTVVACMHLMWTRPL